MIPEKEKDICQKCGGPNGSEFYCDSCGQVRCVECFGENACIDCEEPEDVNSNNLAWPPR